jgi:hypothetical protein
MTTKVRLLKPAKLYDNKGILQAGEYNVYKYKKVPAVYRYLCGCGKKHDTFHFIVLSEDGYSERAGINLCDLKVIK